MENKQQEILELLKYLINYQTVSKDKKITNKSENF